MTFLTSSTPATKATSITPSDTVDLGVACRGLYVGVAGDVKVILETDTTAVTFIGVAAGTILPIVCSRVYATGSAGGAGDYIALS